MKKKDPQISAELGSNRRSFLKKGVAAAGAATVGMGLLKSPSRAFARDNEGNNGKLNRGDAAILRFLQALETIEADLWRQYAELGGAGANTPGTVGNSPIDLSFPTALAPLYIAGLEQLDADMPQYIDDNTDDEFSHESFLRAYLESKGEQIADLSKFFNLSPSQVTGVPNIGRLTNLTQLTVDTSWWTRYRSDSKNPDLGDTFPQAVQGLSAGQFPAIPRNDGDLNPSDHLQAIANTAGFHFCFIEQGGTSLYAGLAQRVTHPEVLRILLSIGPTEAMHFQTWHDKAGNAPALTDPTNGLVFPDLNAPPFGGEDFQTNLIMPEPPVFLNRTFPIVSIVRPTKTAGAAMAALNALTADGLFIGQTPAFFAFLRQLAHAADQARHGG